jgi:hypothetical protein
VTGALLQTTLKTVTIPAKLLQNNSKIEIDSTWQMTASTNNRYMTMKHNTDDLFQLTSSNQASYEDYRFIRNRGVKTSQIGAAIGAAGLYVGQTPRTASIDTDAALMTQFWIVTACELVT